MIKRLLTSCFGLGLLPGAPGTWGSVPVALSFSLMCQYGTEPLPTECVMAVLVVVGAVVCVVFAPAVIAATGRADPREVVMDEVAGQALCLFAGSLGVIGQLAGWRIWVAGASGFAVFRFFDILKPWPIREVEKFPQGWGVLADDLLAGLYAAAVLQIVIRLWLV